LRKVCQGVNGVNLFDYSPDGILRKKDAPVTFVYTGLGSNIFETEWYIMHSKFARSAKHIFNSFVL